MWDAGVVKGAPLPATDDAADAALLARVVAGDQQALAAVYDRHSGLLLGLGVRLLSNRAEAEDVLHDVFVEAWKRAADFDPARGSVRTWLAMRMRSRCLDRQKSPRVSRSVEYDTSEAARTAAPEQDPLLRLQRVRVREALAALSDDQRTVVELAGVAQGTVKSRLFAARDKLAKALVDVDGASALGGRHEQ
jgi:RNA polymerase sigma-70 factor (ECF subfamily)